jgi:hypothetical protein
MKKTLIASMIATAFSSTAHAVPMSFIEEIMAGIPAIEDSIVVERGMVLAASDDGNAHADAMRRWGEEFSQELHNNLSTLYAPRLASSRLVKGAPYSAEVITENNQSLADGNVITRKTVGAVFRDGEGRTRQESGGDGKKRPTIYINDPVEARHIVLIPDAKKAIVTPRGAGITMLHEEGGKDKRKDVKEKRVVKVGGNEIRIEDGRVYLDGKEVTDGTVELKSGGKEIRVENGKVTIDGKDIVSGHQRVVVRSVDEKETGDGTRREEIRVQVVHAGNKDSTLPLTPLPPMPPMNGAPMVIPPLPPMPGVDTLRFESTARLGKGVTTQLGAKDFEGVRAEGKSTVWTIPAGEIGNRNPIQVMSESWYSPELKVTVYSRYNDPRTGESLYRLANIRRAEPARDLFTIPEGYDSKGRGKKEEKR